MAALALVLVSTTAVGIALPGRLMDVAAATGVLLSLVLALRAWRAARLAERREGRRCDGRSTRGLVRQEVGVVVTSVCRTSASEMIATAHPRPRWQGQV